MLDKKSPLDVFYTTAPEEVMHKWKKTINNAHRKEMIE